MKYILILLSFYTAGVTLGQTKAGDFVGKYSTYFYVSPNNISSNVLITPPLNNAKDSIMTVPVTYAPPCITPYYTIIFTPTVVITLNKDHAASKVSRSSIFGNSVQYGRWYSKGDSCIITFSLEDLTYCKIFVCVNPNVKETTPSGPGKLSPVIKEQYVLRDGFLYETSNLSTPVYIKD